MIEVSEDLIGQTFEEGFLLSAHLHPNSYGVFRLWQFETLAILGSKDSIQYGISCQKFYTAAQEPADWPEHIRTTQPHDRTTPETYFAFKYPELDIFPTSNASRFLSCKETFYRPDAAPTYLTGSHKVNALICSPVELAEYLSDFLPRLGVPESDIDKVIEEVFTKLDL